MADSSLRIVMYPWFARGHLTAFLHMSNKLATRGHKIFFFLPSKTQVKLQQFNDHPQNLKFIPLILPQVEGFPLGAETTLDVPFQLLPLLRLAMDLTRPTIESFLQEMKPHFVFLDFQHWLPSVTRPLGIKSIQFLVITPAAVAYSAYNEEPTACALMKAAQGFPSSAIKLCKHETRGRHFMYNQKDIRSGMTFLRRLSIALVECDAIGFKASREMEGIYCEFLEKNVQETNYSCRSSSARATTLIVLLVVAFGGEISPQM